MRRTNPEENFSPDYQKLYSLLFNAMTDAVEALRKCNYGVAADLLIAAQQKAEDLYIGGEDDPEQPGGRAD